MPERGWSDLVVSSTSSSVSGKPGGSNTHVQYNNNGVLGGDSGFTYESGNVGININPNTTSQVNLPRLACSKTDTNTSSTTTVNANFYTEIILNPSSTSSRGGSSGLFHTEIPSGNSANISGIVYGGNYRVFHYGTGTLSEVRGLSLVARNRSTGTITQAYGGLFTLINDTTGTFTTAIGGYFALGQLSSGTTTNAYLGYFTISSNSGTITNCVGLYVVALSGTNVVGAFIDPQVASATVLRLKAASGQTGRIIDVQNSSGTSISGISAEGYLINATRTGSAPSGSAPTGSMVFRTDSNRLYIYNGSSWVSVALS